MEELPNEQRVRSQHFAEAAGEQAKPLRCHETAIKDLFPRPGASKKFRPATVPATAPIAIVVASRNPHHGGLGKARGAQ
jgi:hypothetical protein